MASETPLFFPQKPRVCKANRNVNSVAAPWAPLAGKHDRQAGKEAHQSVAKAPGAQISLAGTGQRPGTVLGMPCPHR